MQSGWKMAIGRKNVFSEYLLQAGIIGFSFIDNSLL